MSDSGEPAYIVFEQLDNHLQRLYNSLIDICALLMHANRKRDDLPPELLSDLDEHLLLLAQTIEMFKVLCDLGNMPEAFTGLEVSWDQLWTNYVRILISTNSFIAQHLEPRLPELIEL